MSFLAGKKFPTAEPLRGKAFSAGFAEFSKNRLSEIANGRTLTGQGIQRENFSFGENRWQEIANSLTFGTDA